MGCIAALTLDSLAPSMHFLLAHDHTMAHASMDLFVSAQTCCELLSLAGSRPTCQPSRADMSQQNLIFHFAVQIVETSLAVALAFFYMPKTPILEESILQVRPPGLTDPRLPHLNAPPSMLWNAC